MCKTLYMHICTQPHVETEPCRHPRTSTLTCIQHRSQGAPYSLSICVNTLTLRCVCVCVCVYFKSFQGSHFSHPFMLSPSLYNLSDIWKLAQHRPLKMLFCIQHSLEETWCLSHGLVFFSHIDHSWQTFTASIILFPYHLHSWHTKTWVG